MSLLLSVNQNDNLIPYKFSITGLSVYTFEQALYHVYNYWKESLDDFLAPAFALWVKDALEQKYLSTCVSDLNTLENTGEKLLKFLSLTDYYDGAALAALKMEIDDWEKQLEWERLKEMGDYMMKRNEAPKAHQYYKKALAFGDNVRILNNMGICLMEMEIYDEAAGYLEKAYELDKNDFDIIINYSEALILSRDFERAFKMLRKAEKFGDRPVINYLYGKLCQESNNMAEAMNYYKKAALAEYDPIYYYALSNVYTKTRQFNKALDTLDYIKEKDKVFYINQAEVYSAFEDYASAVKCMEQAVIFSERDNPNLWAMLSKYHRLNLDLKKAEGAASKALSLDSENRLARLELARIKKAQGKTKDYQEGLSRIMESFKREYRDLAK
ncbi:MAG: tetratricopeptide repeat protein [Clostridiales bacterium]|jgi:tetratricopeptide (TPR) repeat protein|nr:tetratricopeptide repeat protein [Clostridiales bacterium]